MLFDPMDEKSIGDVLTRMLSLPTEEADILRHLNRERIVALCSPQAFTKKYLALLQ